MKEGFGYIIRNIIISILIVICIIIVISLVFYDKIAINRVIPEVEEYYLTDDMKEEIEDSNLDEAKEVIITYNIDATDLKKYEKNKEYIKGKNHPFAATSDYAASNNISSSTSGSSGFYEDDGTK